MTVPTDIAEQTGPASPGDGRNRGRRRGRAVLGAVAVVGTVAAAVAATVGFGGGGGGSPAGADLPPATARVTKQTLYDTESVDGDLGYGPVTSLSARKPGTITWLPVGGAVIKRGAPLYRLDTEPVVLMYGSVPAYRTLGPGDEGSDVRQLEQNLKALGYTGFTVDDEYTWSTAEAVRDWQQDLGVERTGRVELGRVVFAGGEVRVDSVTAQPGQAATPGQAVLAYTGTTRVVTVRLDLADQRLARKGAKVSIELPGGRPVAGVVRQVQTVIEEGNGQGEEPDTKVEAIVSLSDPAAAKGLDAATVDVVFTAGRRPDVLTVPVSALLALAEGGYGVEVITGSTSSYLPVTTGLFADGRVEISGTGLADGVVVGIPR